VEVKGLVFFLALLVFGGARGQEAKVTVRPAGVTLIWEQGDKDAFDHQAVLNSQKPVALALYVEAENKKIVSFDADKSKLTSITDDQGTKIKGSVAHFPRIAKDGSAAFIEVRGEDPVSPQAETLFVKGVLKLAVASKTEAKRSKVVEAKKGSKVELAENLVFEISEAGKPGWGDDPFALTLKIKRDIPEVAKVRFFDGEGKQIEASRSGSSRGGFFNKVTVTRDYNLKRKVDKISVEVDLWTDLEEIMVPFDVKVGVGGAK
jgi:hypothetical protein